MRRSSAVQGFGAAWRRIVACVQGDAPTALELTERDGLAGDLRTCRAQLEGALRSLAPVEDTPRDEQDDRQPSDPAAAARETMSAPR